MIKTHYFRTNLKPPQYKKLKINILETLSYSDEVEVRLQAKNLSNRLKNIKNNTPDSLNIKVN